MLVDQADELGAADGTDSDYAAVTAQYYEGAA